MWGILPYMLYYTEHKVAGPCPRPLFSDKNHCFYIRHKIRLYNCNHICNLLFLLYLLHLRIFHGHCKHHHSSQLDISNILDPTRPHLDSMLSKRLHRLYPENCSWLSLTIPIVLPAPLMLTVTLFRNFCVVQTLMIYVGIYDGKYFWKRSRISSMISNTLILILLVLIETILLFPLHIFQEKNYKKSYHLCHPYKHILKHATSESQKLPIFPDFFLPILYFRHQNFVSLFFLILGCEVPKLVFLRWTIKQSILTWKYLYH